MLGGTSWAWAGVISLEVQPRPTIRDDTLEVSVDITNQGDEPAYAVKVSVEVQDAVWMSPAREALEAQAHHTVDYQRPIKGLGRGSYPLIVRVFYTDAQGYPFSALAVSQVTVGEDIAPAVWAVLENGQLRTQGQLSLRVKNLEDRRQTVIVRPVLPQELTTQPSRLTRTLEPSQDTRMTFRLKNFSARGESTYPVYAVIEENRHDAHLTTVSAATVHIVSGPPLQPYQTTFLILGGVLLLMVVLLNVRGSRSTT